jgi:hypothetical protein
MATLGKLKDLTGAKWRQAKKDAGVKGASFFDTSGGKAVADKIDTYQKAKDAFESSKNSKTFEKYAEALLALDKALTVSHNDRTFGTALAKTMQSEIEDLLKETHAKLQEIAKIHNSKEEMAKLAKNDLEHLDDIVKKSGLPGLK